MSVAGPTIAGTGTDGANGNVVWSNPSRVTANDGSFAAATLTAVTVSNEIKSTNFGFSIPLGATVSQVQVDVFKKKA